jgi:hypothetical protein
MNFSSLSSTAAGDGDIFYKITPNSQSATQDKKEALFILKWHTDQELQVDPSVSLFHRKYLTEVHRVQVNCTDNNKITDLRYEDYDASNNLV